ncbi:MAG: DUF4058 family protein [Pirellulaceae bacterium]|nr:DUF4058 family protein [Pirellulaceae bacterium]
MAMPFPGMDPYLENPILWTGVHSRLINSISSQIAPALRPRYVVSIEERVVIDLPQQQRVPDLWIQKTSNSVREEGDSPSAVLAEPVVMELTDAPIREPYIEILDRYQDLQVVTVLELLSPINKAAGPGRDQYLKKRAETLNSSTHLVEIDLLRTGLRSTDFTEAQLAALGAFDYLISINRFRGYRTAAGRTRVELFPCQLRNPLPRFGLPLVPPDPDVALDLQAALDRVYEEGSYMLRINYTQPCLPNLSDDDQHWLQTRWTNYQASHPDLFG